MKELEHKERKETKKESSHIPKKNLGNMKFHMFENTKSRMACFNSLTVDKEWKYKKIYRIIKNKSGAFSENAF